MQYITIYPLKNNKWRAEVRFNSDRKTKVHSSETEAKRWAAATEREFILNHATQEALSAKNIVITLSEALRRYSAEKSQFKKTAKKEMQRILYYQEHLPNADWPLVNYKSDFIAQWRDQVMNRAVKPMKASSVLRDFSTLHSVFEWCIEKKWIKINPLDGVKKLGKPPNRERRIETEEVNKMLAALKYVPGTIPETKMQETALIWIIALATGMRSGEIVNRHIKDVDIKRGIVTLPDTKNGSKRVVPLDDFATRLWAIALKIDRNSKSNRVFNVTDSSRDALFRKARKAAGLEGADLTFHDSRHEAASLMAKRLKNPLTLCKVFGWKDPKFALVYYNPTHDEIRNELNQSNGLDSLVKKTA